jgi:4-hydroxybenzoate polyprenyltransferase
MLPAALDALAWSSLGIALAAAALAAAASQALGVPPAPAVLGLAFGGTLVVYVIDRLRDLARDRASAPARAAFVERHRRALLALAGLGAALAAGSALALRPPAVALALAVGALGLAHRRLKRWWLVKPAYLTFAWTAVPVCLPAAQDPAARHVGFAAAVVGASVLANVALSNLRDGEGVAGRIGARRTRAVAATVLAGGLGAALFAPPAVRPLAALPVAMGAALLGFRPSERYGALVVDGALLAGALAALALGAFVVACAPA